MDFNEIRRRVGEAVIGESLRDSARIKTGFTLVSTTSMERPGNLIHAKKSVDQFWKRDGGNVQKIWLDQFISDLEGDYDRYCRIYALAANHNRLVNDGTRIFNFYLTNIATNSAAGAAIGTRPTILQLGTNGTNTHLATYTGCVTPLTSPSNMAEAAATVTQVTTDSNYTFDTIQLRKTNFQNNTGGGTVVTVREIAMRNTDATKIAFCRTYVSDVAVADTGNLDATYKFQLVP